MKMKHLFPIFLFLISCAGVQSKQGVPTVDKTMTIEIPANVKTSDTEFKSALEKGTATLRAFALRHDLLVFMETPLVGRAVLLENKKKFDDAIIKNANLPEDTKIPSSYVAVVESDALWILPPAEVARLNPRDAKDSDFYGKLIAHELAHVLHVRALKGSEQDMGPVWFYEGFAVAASGQFADFKWSGRRNEFEQVIRDEKRGDYQKYGVLVRELLKHHKANELLSRAKDKGFNDWVASEIGKFWGRS